MVYEVLENSRVGETISLPIPQYTMVESLVSRGVVSWSPFAQLFFTRMLGLQEQEEQTLAQLLLPEDLFGAHLPKRWGEMRAALPWLYHRSLNPWAGVALALRYVQLGWDTRVTRVIVIHEDPYGQNLLIAVEPNGKGDFRTAFDMVEAESPIRHCTGILLAP